MSTPSIHPSLMFYSGAIPATEHPVYKEHPARTASGMFPDPLAVLPVSKPRLQTTYRAKSELAP